MTKSLSNSEVGRVYLVGAGPGDAGLVTLRGLECLRRADVVLYDYLVNPKILNWTRAAADRICLGQHGQTRIWTQSEINTALVDLACQGKQVVRLKGGDPAVFARGGDEVEALQQAAIPFEIVPGITSALAAGSYSGIPLTHRGIASAVAFVTGHEDAEKPDEPLDYGRLALFPGTLVLYMGVTTATIWSQALIAAGKAADTPVAIIRRCTLPDQRIVRCRLSEVVETIQAAPRIRPPAVFIVGPVVDLAPAISWFAQRPLFGRKILVTRPAGQTEELAELLARQGADVICQPAIRICAPRSFAKLDATLNRLSEFDWLVFSSANGVNFFLERLFELGKDIRALGGLRLAAIGPGTADALRQFHLHADIVPREFRAEALAAELVDPCRGNRCLLIRASRGREVLAETLQSAGTFVEQVVAYESSDEDLANPDVLKQLQSRTIDWITVTSSAIARSLSNMLGESLKLTKIVSISPVTSATIRSLGYEPSAEAQAYTMAGVVEAILTHENAGK